MTRTLTERSRRAQIVQAAIETIAEVGYGQASFARIAERAGLLSTGLISYHFAGKNDLMEQIVVDAYTRGAYFVIPRIQAETSAAGKLRAYVEANLEFIARNRQAITAVIQVIANLREPDGSPRFNEASDEPTVQGTEWILKEGQANGEFGVFDARVMALAIRAVIDRAPFHFAAYADLDWQAYAREVAALFERATRGATGRVSQGDEEAASR